ncbi:unnamed protein product [Cuscuta europaea]|uniref:Uncharacterized protein n=1 Tax=Cuscuta europaea TaxID=41803 RepID=A0A9P1EMD4_CUSEU|nr:unnamed protein product [Cuscuta europaea]
MEFSEDWKSLWPVSLSFSPPLLLPNKTSKRQRLEKRSIGPLIFNPCRETLIELFYSPSISPRLPPPYPEVTLPKYLLTSSALPIASTIASDLRGSQDPDTVHNFNALQLLHCPNLEADSDDTMVLAVFPTGDNSDQLGLAVLTLNDSKFMSVKKLKDRSDFFVHSHRLNHRISRLLINPVNDFDVFLSSSSSSFCYTVIGYVMVCTTYSVHWYIVKMPRDVGLGDVVLEYGGHAGVKLFQGSSIIHACWSPHLSDECIVLLENGKLFLFDISFCLKKINRRTLDVQGQQLCISWGSYLNEKSGSWLSCEFSWHTRLLVVAHSSTLFLVDLRSDSCEVSILLKADFLSTENFDRFVAISQSDSSGFCFAVSSNRLLILCDVRKPSMPVLQWAHNLQNPKYITVLKLSTLRPAAEDNYDFKWASESGHCILLGSFWSCEFILFFYGPPDDRRGPHAISSVCNSLSSWGVPSELCLSGRECFCGSCLVKGDFLKDLLPVWVDWKQKKHIVLGFAILDGFSLVRLMSSGKLEAQRYVAAWEFNNISGEAHKESMLSITEENFLYDTYDNEEHTKHKFEYLRMDFLKEYLCGNLARLVDNRQKSNQRCAEGNKSKFHHEICEKLKECGTALLRPPHVISVILKKAVTFPTSINEVVLKSIWGSLPMNLLALAAFSAFFNGSKVYSDKTRFLFPFASSSEEQVRSSYDDVAAHVCPVLPTHLLIVLRKQQLEETGIPPVDDEFQNECDKVLKTAFAMQNGEMLSLADENDEIPKMAEKMNVFCFHKPTFTSSRSDDNLSRRRYETFVSKKCQKEVLGVVKEVFDEGCPLELNFNCCDFDLTPNELDFLQRMKRHDLIFVERFQPYQEYLNSQER